MLSWYCGYIGSNMSIPFGVGTLGPFGKWQVEKKVGKWAESGELSISFAGWDFVKWGKGSCPVSMSMSIWYVQWLPFHSMRWGREGKWKESNLHHSLINCINANGSSIFFFFAFSSSKNALCGINFLHLHSPTTTTFGYGTVVFFRLPSIIQSFSIADSYSEHNSSC